MKKFLFVLLITTSFSCFANEIEYAKITAENLLNSTPLENYYKNPNCSSVPSLIVHDHSIVMETLFSGFIMGIYETDSKCITEILKKRSDLKDLFVIASWLAYGDGDYSQNKEGIINKSFAENTFFKNAMGDQWFAFALGYFYATGNENVIKNIRYLITQAKKEHCFNSVIYTRRDCPLETARKYTSPEKFQTPECIKQLQEDKEGICPEPATLFAASSFLKKYDINWYNQNVKDWLPKKEAFYQQEIEKERIESEKRRLKLEKEREAKNVILIDGESFQLADLEKRKKEILKECTTQDDCQPLGNYFYCNQKHPSIGKSYCLKATPKTFTVNNITYYRDSAQDQIQRCPLHEKPDDILSGCLTNACYYTYQAAKNYCNSFGKDLLSQKTILDNCKGFSEKIMHMTYWTKEISPVWINADMDKLCSIYPHERTDGYCPTGRIICK